MTEWTVGEERMRRLLWCCEECDGPCPGDPGDPALAELDADAPWDN